MKQSSDFIDASGMLLTKDAIQGGVKKDDLYRFIAAVMASTNLLLMFRSGFAKSADTSNVALPSMLSTPSARSGTWFGS